MNALLPTLRLIRSENVGPVTYHQLLRRYGSAQAALDALPELARRGGKKSYAPCPASRAEEEIARCAAFGARMIVHGTTEYPALLAHINDAPPVLSMFGHAHLWQSRPTFAIVGARNASANGCQFARRLARELGEAGVTVVSGLARGIDAYAHQGALGSGTVGVIAGGIDNIYPPENRDLYGMMRAQGAVVSENPFSAAPMSRSFPARNRIISGMSLGVLVVEASKKSGSLITGRMALDQGRDVFAIPGSPLDPRCQGTNMLLKDGAILTESVDDILPVLKNPAWRASETKQFDFFLAEPGAEPPENELAKARERVAELLSAHPVAVDTLIEMSGLPVGTVLTILLEKELAGMIQRHPGNRVSLLY